MRCLGLLVSASFLLVAAPLPAASGSSCDDTESGFSTQTAMCTFSCGVNEWVRVSVSVDDGGDVSGWASCGGAGAACSDADGYCDATSGTTTTSSASVPDNCQGTGDGGAWSRVYVACSTQAAGAGGGDGRKPGHVAAQLVLSSVSTIAGDEVDAALTPTDGITTWMIGVGGHFAGYRCAAGSGCVPIPIRCAITGDAWACSAR